MLTSLSLFSFLRSEIMTSSGNFSKAESVGAKTVNGPSSERVFAKPASTAALSKVLKLPALLATLTILSALALSEAPTSNKDKKNLDFSTHLIFATKNLERAGDHITNIAESICFLIKGEYLKGSRPKGKVIQQ